jgi:hypothetical protein
MIDVEDDAGKKKTLLKRYRQLDELNDKVITCNVTTNS